MNPPISHRPCHLCGQLEHAQQMKVNLQNGALLCQYCVWEHFEPWRDESEEADKLALQPPSRSADIPLWPQLLPWNAMARHITMPRKILSAILSLRRWAGQSTAHQAGYAMDIVKSTGRKR